MLLAAGDLYEHSSFLRLIPCERSCRIGKCGCYRLSIVIREVSRSEAAAPLSKAAKAEPQSMADQPPVVRGHATDVRGDNSAGEGGACPGICRCVGRGTPDDMGDARALSGEDSGSAGGVPAAVWGKAREDVSLRVRTRISGSG